LPAEIAQDVMAYVGCIAGALRIEDYQRQLMDAGFADVVIVDTKADLNAYAKIENQSGCCSPAITPASSSATQASRPLPIASSSSCCGSGSSTHEGLAELLRRYNVNDYAASVRVFAIKPANRFL